MVMCDVRSWCGWYLCSRPVNYSSSNSSSNSSNSSIHSVILVQICVVIKLLTLTRVNGGWMDVDIVFLIKKCYYRFRLDLKNSYLSINCFWGQMKALTSFFQYIDLSPAPIHTDIHTHLLPLQAVCTHLSTYVYLYNIHTKHCTINN